MQTFRRTAVHLALVAMMLRAFLPAGWMPNIAHDGGTFLVACSMAGDTGHQDNGKAPVDDPHAHDACPFAAAAPLAAPVDFIAFAAPAVSHVLTPQPLQGELAPRGSRYNPAPARAPPLSA